MLVLPVEHDSLELFGQAADFTFALGFLDLSQT
jgi:hypothetical protein